MHSFSKRLRELHIIAAESSEEEATVSTTGEDSIYESLSAKDGDFSTSDVAISSTLNPIQLPKDRMSDYVNTFFPTNRAFMTNVVQELTTISGRLNSLFAFYRYCLYSARGIASMGKEQLAEHLNSVAAQTLDQAITGQGFDGKGSKGKSPFQNALEKFLDNTGSGNMHVVVPSKRYPGGFDFQFIGGTGTSTNSIPTLHVHNGQYGIITSSQVGIAEDTLYQREYLESYATEFSQNVVNAGNEVLELLFPKQNVTSGAEGLERKVSTLPFSFNFEAIDDVFYKHTGIIIQTRFISNLPRKSYSDIEEFFSPLIIRTPNHQVMQKQLSRLNGVPDGQTISTDMSANLTREGLALSQTISLSVAITLPVDIVEYVSQAPKGGTISFLSLHNWASIWSRQYFKKARSASSGGRIGRSSIPKYVLPLSQTLKVTETRKQAGLTVEPGKVDANNIFIAPDGSLSYLPNQDARSSLDNVIEYEKDMEAYIKKCFELGLPLSTSSIPPELSAKAGTRVGNTEFRELQAKSQSHSGKLLTYDWDYNIVTTVNVSDPSSMVATDINGSAVPDSLTIGDYLGYDLAKDGEAPMVKSFADSIMLMLNADPGNAKSSDIIGNALVPDNIINRFGPFKELLSFYRYCAIKGKVPGIAGLIKLAAGELGLNTLKDDEKKQDLIFKTAITDDLKPSSFYSEANDASMVELFIRTVLSRTMIECSGNRNSYIRQAVANELDTNDLAALEEEIQDHPSYFDPSKSSMGDFGRLYSYIGGAIFKVAMERLTALSPAQLFNSEEDVTVPPTTPGGREETLSKPTYKVVSKSVMPLAVMFSKYVPDAERYLEEARQQAEANTRDETIDVDDIKVASCKKGAQMFPHQVGAHKSLRKHPKFAILDVAPGGGKTSISLTDIGALVKELNDVGDKQIKPIILCPDGLIKNWIDDMSIFTGNKWNMIPINTSIMKRWGSEKLAELLEDSPPNSIVVTGFNFLRGNSFKVAIGTRAITISGNLEFIKRFGFDYIGIDESHKLKTKTSARHKVAKQLTTASYVRFIRILSGTIIADRVRDIVGQTALVNSHIFRDSEFATNLNVDAAIERRRELELNGEAVPTWEVDTPQRARQKLSNYASVITMKRKEWAFMLPSPIEVFHPINLDPSGEEGVTEKEKLEGQMHQQLYDTVLQESMEELEDLMKKAKSRKGMDDEGDDSDDDDDELELGDADELGGLSSADLKPYLQRIERLITNPMADPLAPEIFGAAGIKHYVSRKAKYIANLVKKHFEPEEWSKDKLYREHSLVSHNNTLYFARKSNNASHTRSKLPEATQGVPPNEDTETWKVEPEGKIIIFCRYTNSVNGVYDALSSQHKQMAVKFTGEEDDKWSNLDAFINDPKIKILVANEMGISEGHNLQMASRIIRVESPWGPGELDQSSSRIFRPDPKAAKAAIENGKPGELYRDVIFLDWVLADNTMEIAKQSRLIAKIFNKARFDEAENTKKFATNVDGVVTESTYADILDRYDIDEISMSLETLRSRDSLHDPNIAEYVQAYAQLNDLMRQEFHEMRITQDHTMKDLEPQEDLPGSRKIQTPYVAGQKAPEDGKTKLVSIKQFVRKEGNEEYAKDPNLLIGKPVVTDLGKGQIVRVNVRYMRRVAHDSEGKPVLKGGKKVTEFVVDEYGNKKVDPDSPISSFVIKTHGDNQISPIFPDTGLGFIPLNVDNKTIEAEYKVDTLNITKKGIRDEEKARDAEEEKERKQAILEDKRRAKEARQAKARAESAADAKQRKANIEKGKPINAGIKKQKVVPASKKGLLKNEVPGADMKIKLHPASYHGFLVLEGDASDPDAANLAKQGFKLSGPYVYVSTDRWNRFSKILDYIEDNFHLSNASLDRLTEIQDAFEEDRKAIYRSSLAPTSKLPYFFATKKHIVKDKKEIRPYPIVMPNELIIAVDLRTSPAIRRHIGKTIPGAVTQWTKSEGDTLYFARNKADLKNKVKDLIKKGFEIENLDELKKEIANLKFRPSSGKK